MQNQPLTSAEQELERSLARLSPALPPDARDSIAYQAGRRSARRPLLLWRITTATLAAALTLALFPHPPSSPLPSTPSQYVSIPLPTSPTSPPPLPPNAYLALRDAVLAHGLDALPSLPPTPRGHNDPPTRAIDIHNFPLDNFFGEHS